MGSPITFSGFNQIDFSVVLNAVMQQESRPLQVLQARQQALKTTDGVLAQLAGKIDAIGSAASALSSASAFHQVSASSSDQGAVAVSATRGAAPGRYDLVVNELARAQVTVSATAAADTDTTVVATGGTLTIGGTAVTLSGTATLRQLADQINATPDIPVKAAIVETAPGSYRLVLTSQQTGAGYAFGIENGLTASTIAFTDTDGDGISGNTAADNAVQASNASLSLNNIPIVSESNTLDGAIPGATITLLQKDPAKTVAVAISRDDESLVTQVEGFVSAYNDLVQFAKSQRTSGEQGNSGTIERNALLRNLHSTLRDALTGQHGSGAYTYLAEVGIAFSRTGELTVDRAALTEAIQANRSAVQQMFSDESSGAFTQVSAVMADYTKSGGLVPGARTRVSEELSRLGDRIDDMQARLAIRRAALQREFTAADAVISRLNSQSGSLSSFAASLKSSTL